MLPHMHAHAKNILLCCCTTLLLLLLLSLLHPSSVCREEVCCQLDGLACLKGRQATIRAASTPESIPERALQCTQQQALRSMMDTACALLPAAQQPTQAAVLASNRAADHAYVAAGGLWVVQHLLCECDLLPLGLSLSAAAGAVLAGLPGPTCTHLTVVLLGHCSRQRQQQKLERVPYESAADTAAAALLPEAPPPPCSLKPLPPSPARVHTQEQAV